MVGTYGRTKPLSSYPGSKRERDWTSTMPFKANDLRNFQ
jgi:hypothetical protein